MKTLILHLGLQKTGSTSIQETFLENPEVLPQFGFDYFPLVWPDGTLNSNHSFPLLATFTDGWHRHGEVTRRAWEPKGLKEHFTGEIERMLSSQRNLVVSGEDISDLGREGLRAFAARAGERGFDIRPIMLVRSPLAFFTSMTQTRIRHGKPFELFTTDKSNRIAECLELWPGMICIPFSEALRHRHGPLGSLLDHAGLPPASRFDPVQQNESMSEYATRIVGYINTELPLYLDGALNPKRFYLDTEPLATIPGPKFMLTRPDFNEVRGMVQTENIAFARMLGPAFCDPVFQFKEMPEPWTEAALRALARAMPEVSPDLQTLCRRYFADPRNANPAECAMARAILGESPD